MLLNCGAGDDSWESLGQQGNETGQSQRKSILNIHWKGWCWSWSSNTLATYAKSWLTGKDPDAGKDWGQEEKGATEDEMVGWGHWFSGHKFESTLVDNEGLASLASCSPWGLQRVGHDWATEQQHFRWNYIHFFITELVRAFIIQMNIENVQDGKRVRSIV